MELTIGREAPIAGIEILGNQIEIHHTPAQAKHDVSHKIASKLFECLRGRRLRIRVVRPQ
jgi:hypothetical protein